LATVNLHPLTALTPDTLLVVDGDRALRVPAEIAERFKPGDALVCVAEQQQLLLIPLRERQVAERAVSAAVGAFEELVSVSDAQIDDFYAHCAAALESEAIWSEIARVNREDVEDAKRRGRSTTRLVATDKMRRGMIEGLRGWARMPSGRGRRLERVEHEGWSVDLTTAPLGVVAFVFEGRPNVLADATGVLKSGNSVVFRIGRDALRTAREIMLRAVAPSLANAGLPTNAVCLLESSEHAAGWALFGDRRLGLAVARGSGAAVATLGGLARQAGVPVSVHGTGGAWLTASASASEPELEQAVFESLTRKVCNTLNVCCLPRSQHERLVPAFLRGLARAAERRGQPFKLHVVRGDESAVPSELFARRVPVTRAEGVVQEQQAELIDEDGLSKEWEWEETPELSLKLVDDLAHAVALFNRHSPKLVACLVSPDAREHEYFFQHVDSPFVGDGFTQWVDGQYALGRPELGLSNWEHGRLLTRGGVLTGDGIYTIRTRARRSAR
jgi:glutamate-5-semialdehyde dehydrogenase